MHSWPSRLDAASRGCCSCEIKQYNSFQISQLSRQFKVETIFFLIDGEGSDSLIPSFGNTPLRILIAKLKSHHKGELKQVNS